MSVGLDALNKLQRARAESAAGGASLVLDSELRAKPQINRLLAAGFAVSVAVAAFSFLRSGGTPAGPAPSVREPATNPGAVSQPMAAPASPAQPEPIARSSVLFSVPTSSDAKAGRASNSAPRTLLPGQSSLVDAYVEAGQVGGVDLRLGSGEGPIVMFNDILCHVNDLVNPVLGVRLVQITPQELTFRDAHGVLYQKEVPSE